MFPEVNAAQEMIELGRYPEAGAVLERNFARQVPGSSTAYFYTTASHLALRSGDLVTARRCLEVAREAMSGRLIEDPQLLNELYIFGTRDRPVG